MSILRHKLEGGVVSQRDTDGYINASEICTLSGKKAYLWAKLKEGRELIETLAEELEVDSTEIFSSKKGGQQQGTWVHPRLAISVAAWADPKYAIAVSQWLQEWAANNSNPQQSQAGKKVDIQEAMMVADWSEVSLPGLDPSISHVLKLQTFGQLRPDLAHAFEPIIKAIGSATPIPEATLSPTEIGVLLAKDLGLPKVSAIVVNKKLCALEYQESVTRTNSKGKKVHHYYQPTNKGKEFGQVELTPFKSGNGNGTKPNTRWYQGIVPILLREWQKAESN